MPPRGWSRRCLNTLTHCSLSNSTGIEAVKAQHSKRPDAGPRHSAPIKPHQDFDLPLAITLMLHGDSVVRPTAAFHPAEQFAAPPARRIDASPSILPEALQGTGRRHWRARLWRLQFHLLRTVEMLVRIAVLRATPRSLDLRSAAPSAPATDDPWQRQLSIGHGCSGPDLATPSISAISMGDDQQHSEQIAVAVVGDGHAIAGLVQRLIDLDVRVHATADTIDDYVALRSAGAVPHRFEDMPAVAAQLDLLISTSFARPVGATVVARLPETAVIIDLAGPPGSVDFETSRRLGRRPIWAPAIDRNLETSWPHIAAEIEALVADKQRSPALS